MRDKGLMGLGLWPAAHNRPNPIPVGMNHLQSSTRYVASGTRNRLMMIPIYDMVRMWHSSNSSSSGQL